MTRFSRIATYVALMTSAVSGSAAAAGLNGSMSSMRKQHAVAQAEELDFFRTSAQVKAALAEGKLDSVKGNEDYTLSKVSFPYAQPEVLLFIEHLAFGYREATGEKLVVTSLTRPKALQPGNAHRLSVHPAGMAVDLRVPADPEARSWLEERLLELEREGVLDVTRERNPPHYHVAVFPSPWAKYAAENPLPERPVVVAEAAPVVAAAPAAAAATMPDSLDQADGSAGFGAWAMTALMGIVLAGGSAARRHVPVVVVHPRRRRTD